MERKWEGIDEKEDYRRRKRHKRGRDHLKEIEADTVEAEKESDTLPFWGGRGLKLNPLTQTWQAACSLKGKQFDRGNTDLLRSPLTGGIEKDGKGEGERGKKCWLT